MMMNTSLILTFSVFALLDLVVGGSGIRSGRLLDTSHQRCCGHVGPGGDPDGRTCNSLQLTWEPPRVSQEELQNAAAKNEGVAQTDRPAVLQH